MLNRICLYEQGKHVIFHRSERNFFHALNLSFVLTVQHAEHPAPAVIVVAEFVQMLFCIGAAYERKPDGGAVCNAFAYDRAGNFTAVERTERRCAFINV